ncbi:hypothetical protein ACJ73_06149 [Blastomyces percursus]|uniref:AAA+ ATPase domain-containing protein n=1 Tax=Blastomyces percursus TaxID=1658174 RepID=A0A1J9Q343_9EURO|nr:hypothetical protein ACJ73_06149 [Blastomyces percursus]
MHRTIIVRTEKYSIKVEHTVHRSTVASLQGAPVKSSSFEIMPTASAPVLRLLKRGDSYFVSAGTGKLLPASLSDLMSSWAGVAMAFEAGYIGDVMRYIRSCPLSSGHLHIVGEKTSFPSAVTLSFYGSHARSITIPSEALNTWPGWVIRAPNLGLLSNILIVGCAFVYVCIWVYDGIWKFCAVEVEIEPRSEEHEHLTTFLECWVTGCLSRRVRSEEWSGQDAPEKIDGEDAPERTEWDWKIVGALRQYRFRPNKICLFLFGGSVFQFRRMERSFEFYSEERYSLRVLGWSCKPIERLLAEARSRHISKSKSKITIFSPGGKPVRQTKIPWWPVKSTSRRSLESISLAKGRKEEVRNDMYSFLNARSAYAKTERPYRRGYLFNGPPGTGKTSLALALAGKFGLDIYTLSLTGQNMTDDELQWLCSHLPRRCILLIEDIDSAGINREETRATQQDSTRQNNQVSLSGLLNAIDGVSSSDGRILVMTTNCRDQLDAALIRPGRVDMEVEFTLASKEQIKSIFQHMYTPEGDTKPTGMATEFANRVPDCQYSPADIQNYLWKHDDPNRAVTEAQDQFPMLHGR